MKIKDSKRFKRQTIQLWVRNIPIFILIYALTATITIVGSNPTCKNLELGHLGSLLSFALREKIMAVILIIGAFYLVASIALYFSGHKLSLRCAQRKIFQSILAPSLFFVAGSYLGITFPLIENISSVLLAVTIVTAILLLATVVANLYEIFEKP